MNAPVVPRPAATITLIRDVADGLEVLMMQRSHASVFMPGVYVFPGGRIDDEDADRALYEICVGMDDAKASALLGVERDGLAYWVGAIRECFEEAGLLLCYDTSGALVRLDRADMQQRYAAHRDALNAGTLKFVDFCRGEKLKLAADRMTYFSHWITPAAAPQRYDTRFFAAIAPLSQDPLHDEKELIDTVWVKPGDALHQDEAGKLALRTPTKATLRQLDAGCDCVSLIEMLAGQKNIPAIMPAIGNDGGRVLPGEPGYQEAVKNPSPKWQ
jgi:8-oxo-dGTP pyrophosphatase MutT (NUDIX family)